MDAHIRVSAIGTRRFLRALPMVASVGPRSHGTIHTSPSDRTMASRGSARPVAPWTRPAWAGDNAGAFAGTPPGSPPPAAHAAGPPVWAARTRRSAAGSRGRMCVPRDGLWRGRAHPSPDGLCTRWTTPKVSLRHRHLQFPWTSLAWSHCISYTRAGVSGA